MKGPDVLQNFPPSLLQEMQPQLFEGGLGGPEGKVESVRLQEEI